MRRCRPLPMLFILGLLAFGPGTVWALRCGSQIVGEGDTKVEVLAKCGEPLLREYIGEDATFNYGYGTYSKRTVEEWTYNFGPNKFMQILRFRGSTLIDIKNGDKGFY